MSSAFIPPGALRALPKTIEADCYNAVRLALSRHGHRPLRLALPGHRGLEIILDNKRWLCIDTTDDDRPVLVWHAFDTGTRSALNAPVHCELLLYHMHAGLVMGSVLDALLQALIHKDER